jgi:hypothetical protein
MNAVVIEHVPVDELPASWRARLSPQAGQVLVTVRIEEEAPTASTGAPPGEDPAFGIWRDREDLTDTAAHVRGIRQPRYNRDGSRNER